MNQKKGAKHKLAPPSGNYKLTITLPGCVLVLLTWLLPDTWWVCEKYWLNKSML